MPGQIFEFAGVWMSLGVPIKATWPWSSKKAERDAEPVEQEEPRRYGRWPDSHYEEQA